MSTGGGKTISKPPAILQEAGGTAKIKGQRKTSQFPARPYITPAGQKGIEYMQKVVNRASNNGKRNTSRPSIIYA